MDVNLFEEEQQFPYLNMPFEEAIKLRYLARHILAFENGELVQMNLEKIDGKIRANGLVYESNNNKSFDAQVVYTSNGVIFYSEIEEILGKRFYSIDKFKYVVDEIEVTSKIEGRDEVIRKIPYPSENRVLR